MEFNSKQISNILEMLQSIDTKSILVALSILESSPSFFLPIKYMLVVNSYLREDIDPEAIQACNEFLVKQISSVELKELEDQIMILDYARGRYKVPQGWNTVHNPLRKFYSKHIQNIDHFINLFSYDHTNYSKIYTHLASLILNEWQNHVEALNVYEIALKIDPLNQSANFGWAYIQHYYYLQRGQKTKIWKSVLKAYKKSIQERPRDHYFKHIGLLCTEMEDYDQAEQNYNIGLELYPEDLVLLNNYACFILKYRKKSSLALEYAEKAFGLNPLRSSILDTLGMIYLDGFSDYDKAHDFFQKALKSNPKNHNSMTRLGDIYAIIGQYKKAEEFYRKGIYDGLNFTTRNKKEMKDKMEKIMALNDIYPIKNLSSYQFWLKRILKNNI